MKIALLVTKHPPSRISPIIPELANLLCRSGASVELIYPDEQPFELARVRVEHDLYVLKSGTESALSLAGALDSLGAAILNPYLVAVRCRDKVVATRALQNAGVPVPDTYIAADPGDLAPLLDNGPLVVKPYRGTGGVGVQVIGDVRELAGVPKTGPTFAQRHHEPHGRDRKIYCIGGDVFGVKRIWPASSFEDKLGEPFAVGPELREIALRCGRALGMDLFGLDVIISEGQPYVVDISSFPGFKGVPDAPVRLASYVRGAATRALEGSSPMAAQ